MLKIRVSWKLIMEKTQHTHKARYPLRRNKREFSWVFRNSKYPINNKVILSSSITFKFETYNTITLQWTVLCKIIIIH